MQILQLPSVSNISYLVTSSSPATQNRRYLFGPGRLNAGTAKIIRRPEAVSGEAKISRLKAMKSKYKLQFSVCQAVAAHINSRQPAIQRGDHCESVPFQIVARLATLKPARVLPNPSLKLSTNSVARQPSSARASPYFALAVQRATLSVPA